MAFIEREKSNVSLIVTQRKPLTTDNRTYSFKVMFAFVSFEVRCIQGPENGPRRLILMEPRLLNEIESEPK